LPVAGGILKLFRMNENIAIIVAETKYGSSIV
jgi:hypothetical protein